MYKKIDLRTPLLILLLTARFIPVFTAGLTTIFTTGFSAGFTAILTAIFTTIFSAGFTSNPTLISLGSCCHLENLIQEIVFSLKDGDKCVA